MFVISVCWPLESCTVACNIGSWYFGCRSILQVGHLDLIEYLKCLYGLMTFTHEHPQNCSVLLLLLLFPIFSSFIHCPFHWCSVHIIICHCLFSYIFDLVSESSTPQLLTSDSSCLISCCSRLQSHCSVLECYINVRHNKMVWTITAGTSFHSCFLILFLLRLRPIQSLQTWSVTVVKLVSSLFVYQTIRMLWYNQSIVLSRANVLVYQECLCVQTKTS